MNNRASSLKKAIENSEQVFANGYFTAISREKLL